MYIYLKALIGGKKDLYTGTSSLVGRHPLLDFIVGLIPLHMHTCICAYIRVTSIL